MFLRPFRASIHWVRDPGFRCAHPGLNSYAASRLKNIPAIDSKDRSALGLSVVAVQTLKLFEGDSTDRSSIWTSQRISALLDIFASMPLTY